MKNKIKKESNNDPVEKRLDVLIRLFIETHNSEKKLTDAEIANILKSAGLSPTESARIMGKKSATDISQYLYKRSKVKSDGETKT